MARDDLSIKLSVTADGKEATDEITTLAREVAALGESAGDSDGQIAALSSELERLGTEAGQIQAFRNLKKALSETEGQLRDAQQEAQKLGKELAATENPTRKMRTAFDQARKSVRQLQEQEQRQRAELQQLRAAMQAAGVATRNLASAQRQNRQEFDRAAVKARELQQRLAGTRKELRAATAEGTKTGAAVKRGMEDGADGAKSLKNSIASARAQLLALLSAAGAMRLARNLTENADAWKQYQAQLKLVTDSTEEQARAEEELFRISQDTRSELDGSIALYARMARSRKELNLEQQELLDLTELVARAFRISGTTQHESAAGTLQLSQALASGVLRGDEFNSVMENGARIAQALADGLGVPIGQLRAMAEAGELSAKRVTTALLSQKDVIAGEYAELPLTIEGALTNISGAWQRYIGEADEAAGASTRVAEGLAKIAEHFDEIADLAITAGEIILAVFAVKGVKALRAFAAEALGAKASMTALNLEIGAATGKLGKLGVTANTALAGFIGWKIGSYLRDEFETVEKAGIALAATLTLTAESMRFVQEAAEAVFTDDTIEQAFARFQERSRQIAQGYAEIWQDADRTAEKTKEAAGGIKETGDAAGDAAPKVGELKGELQGATTEASELSEALKALGVDLEELKTGFTANERTLIESFNTIATSIEASSEIIVAAYRKAVNQAESVRAIKALNDTLFQSFEEGQVAAGDFALALDAGIKKLEELPAAAEAAIAATKEFQDAISNARFTSDLHAMAQEVQEAWKRQEISAEEYKEKIDAINEAMRQLEEEAIASYGATTDATKDATEAAKELAAETTSSAEAMERQADAAERSADAAEREVAARRAVFDYEQLLAASGGDVGRAATGLRRFFGDNAESAERAIEALQQYAAEQRGGADQAPPPDPGQRFTPNRTVHVRLESGSQGVDLFGEDRGIDAVLKEAERARSVSF